MKRPIADPFDIYPDRHPTLHEHCMRHQNCTGEGCRVKGRKWPRRRSPKVNVKPTANMIRPPLPIPHRVVDLLPAKQVIALWEFRQSIVQLRPLGEILIEQGLIPEARVLAGQWWCGVCKMGHELGKACPDSGEIHFDWVKGVRRNA